jgi:hypothetical protein
MALHNWVLMMLTHSVSSLSQSADSFRHGYAVLVWQPVTKFRRLTVSEQPAAGEIVLYKHDAGRV